MRQNFNPTLYFIADPECCGNRPVTTVTMAAIQGGVTMVQYRDKKNDKMTRYDTAADLLKICQQYNIPLLINDDVELAHAIGADGVHIGQGDMNASDARKIIGENKILGLTAFTKEHFNALDPNIVDYTGTGPVFPTLTDKGKPIMGVEKLSTYIEKSPVPVVGIGGINLKNVTQVAKTKAAGIAVMRAIGEAERPDLTADAFLKLYQKTKHAA